MSPVEQNAGVDLPEGPYPNCPGACAGRRTGAARPAISYGGLAGGAGGRRAAAGRPGDVQGTGGTPWWRIVRADGTLPASLSARAAPHYRAEGTPLKATDGPDAGAPVRVDLALARWAPDAAARSVLARLRAGLGP